jgi:large subunit ribosomal protein L25
MDTIEISVHRRAGAGTSAARKLRRSGLIPAVVYGRKRAAISVHVQADEFEDKLTHLEGSHLIRLVHQDGGGGELHDRAVLLREVQRHPVSGDILHADFFEVDLTQRLTVSVPVHYVGKAVGVVAGGILQPVLREVEVECLPTEIPDFLEVDVSALGIHEAVHLSELQLPEGVVAVGDPAQTLVTVLPPTVEEVRPGAEAPEAAAAEGAPAPGEAGAAEAAPTEKGKKGGGGEG